MSDIPEKYPIFLLDPLRVDSAPQLSVGLGGGAKSGNGSGNSSGAGTVTPDLFTGTMSYLIPIEVPEGRKGMSPGLSLDYHSNNGNGWVGMSRELEVGSIERSMKGGVNYSGNCGYRNI